MSTIVSSSIVRSHGSKALATEMVPVTSSSIKITRSETGTGVSAGVGTDVGAGAGVGTDVGAGVGAGVGVGSLAGTGVGVGVSNPETEDHDVV